MHRLSQSERKLFIAAYRWQWSLFAGCRSSGACNVGSRWQDSVIHRGADRRRSHSTLEWLRLVFWYLTVSCLRNPTETGYGFRRVIVKCVRKRCWFFGSFCSNQCHGSIDWCDSVGWVIGGHVVVKNLCHLSPWFTFGTVIIESKGSNASALRWRKKRWGLWVIFGSHCTDILHH